MEILVAGGHGRSYGAWSRCLWKKRPGILESGVFEDLAARPPLPTRALLTDVGNDILYGRDPETIAGWVEECLRRLKVAGAAVTLTGLPLASIATVRPWRYSLFIRVLYPCCAVPFETAVRYAADLDARLETLATEYGARFVRPERDWYGWDPVHIRRSRAREAWERIMAS